MSGLTPDEWHFCCVARLVVYGAIAVELGGYLAVFWWANRKPRGARDV